MSGLFEWVRRGVDGDRRFEVLTLGKFGHQWVIGLGVVTRAELETARRQAVREDEPEVEEALAAALSADATLAELARAAEYLHDGWLPTVFDALTGEKVPNDRGYRSAWLDVPRGLLDAVERNFAGFGLTLSRVEDREVG